MRNGRAQQPALERLKTSPTSAGEGIIFIDANYHAIASDLGAEAILNELGAGSGSSAGELPAQILSVLNGRPKGDLDRASAHLKAGSREYSLRIFLINPQNGFQSAPIFALHLKREVSVMDAVHQVGLDYHLTDREQEVLLGVSMGLTSKELATRMNISPNTVKAFLRMLMLKMGASNRAGIVGKLLEQNGNHQASAQGGP
jgi:DNA-binding CsgD family transcriptional regulator